MFSEITDHSSCFYTCEVSQIFQNSGQVLGATVVILARSTLALDDKVCKEIAELKLGMKVTAVNIYRVQDDSIGDNKVLSAVAAKEMDLHRLVHVAMTDRGYDMGNDGSGVR